ncbi:MAG: helix-turn-helix domain-containing protein, partial [Nannocystaceae bacterium]
ASDPRGPSRPGRSRRPDPRDSPTSTPRDFDAARVHPRDLDLHELAKLLRSVARLTPDRRSFGEWVAAYRRELPLVVPAVDVDAWIAWVLVGVPLFSTTLPTVKRTRDTATRVLLSIALARADGSLSAVARSLGSSRKVLRERMRRLGLYPWG